MNRANLPLAAALLRRGRLRDCILFIVVLLFSVPSSAQTMDSTDLPVLWLKAGRLQPGSESSVHDWQKC
jgi:hypothetical protein